MSETPQFSERDPARTASGQGRPPAAAPATLCGEGTSADGLIRATVTFEGRIADLELDPQALRLGPRRTAESLAHDIKTAVNAAIDELHEMIRQDTGGLLGGDLNLDEATEAFTATMTGLSEDLERAHRRMRTGREEDRNKQ